MIKTLFFISFVTLLGFKNLSCQNLTHSGLLPRINYTKPIDERLSFNGTFFSEVDVADNLSGGVKMEKKVMNLTLIGGAAYKLDPNHILTAGYLFRIIDPFENNPRYEHRFIEQYVHILHLDSWRFRNHFRVEQRFIESPQSSGDYNSYLRLSYSIGWDVPLRGKHLDANELYLNSVCSYFVQLTKPRTAFNNLNEFYFGLGYKTKKMGRFEIGPEAKISVWNTNMDLNTLIFLDLIWYAN